MSALPFDRLRSFAEHSVPAGAKDSIREFLADRFQDRVITYHELREWPDVDSWAFDEARQFTFTPPTYSNRTPDEIARLVGDHPIHRPYVLEVPDVTLIGRQGMKRTADGEFVYYNFDRPASHKASLEMAYDVVDGLSMGTVPFGPALGETRRIDLAVPLINRWATNYSHWTEECLTQIQALRHYESETGERPTLLLPPDSPAFIRESLRQFGYDEGDYRELGADRVHVDRMVLPSIRRFWSGTSEDYVRDPYALRWVRQQLFDAMDAGYDSPSKLLISREQDATERRITNWDAVEAALAEQGFETVVLTELDFMAQKRLFRDADVIVGTHGAGLTELLYAEDAAVVELFGSYVVPPYYEMAQAVGHRYGCLLCDPRGDDLFVDVTELLEAVDRTNTV